MASLNKVTLIGNLGADPEVQYTRTGKAVCTLSIATTNTWSDKESGQKMSETEWHRVVLFNRLAEIAGEYLSKGRQVYIEGRNKTRKWQDQQGNDRYTTEIIGNEMQMLGNKPEDVVSHTVPMNTPEPPIPDDSVIPGVYYVTSES